MSKKLHEPCMDPNPWDEPFGGYPSPEHDRPCGRPKGHDNKGGKGAQWGGGHAEHPSDDDPPTKPVILRRYWEIDNPPVVMKIRHPDDETLKITLGGKEVAYADHDAHGWDGMEAVEQTARSIAKALKIQVDPA